MLISLLLKASSLQAPGTPCFPPFPSLSATSPSPSVLGTLRDLDTSLMPDAPCAPSSRFSHSLSHIFPPGQGSVSVHSPFNPIPLTQESHSGLPHVPLTKVCLPPFPPVLRALCAFPFFPFLPPGYLFLSHKGCSSDSL